MSSSTSTASVGLPRYREFAPSPSLAPWVACFWSIRAHDSPSTTNRVLPDGCVDLITGLPNHSPVVVGAMRAAVVVPLRGSVDLFGVRFRPGRALPFLGNPLVELTDGQVSLDNFWGSSAGEFADTAGRSGLEARAAAIERLLHRRLRHHRDERDANLAAQAVALLRTGRRGRRISDLRRVLGIGERRLERIFGRYVGLSPKFFERIFRFRRALDAIGRVPAGRSPSWARIAFEAGYADQPHLIREFRSLAGVTPNEYAAERRSVGFVQYGEGVTV